MADKFNQDHERMEVKTSDKNRKPILNCNAKRVTTNKKELIRMEKTATLNLRVNPTTKKSAEDVLSRLGIPMSTAIDMYLRQITLTGGIPFRVSLPQAPDAINADLMTTAEIHTKLQEGFEDIEAGRVQDAKAAFAAFREPQMREYPVKITEKAKESME